ncbi:hypothetical protein BB561_000099 [Smittium simulii]|uniref:SAC domain-containing protein n=1 Tax=Smittium simulii TaxID=133385 RepID=A0A2T9Z0J7_9FUNG|nr:hypothetical protein BB561_000099 [Smittium simulii]
MDSSEFKIQIGFYDSYIAIKKSEGDQDYYIKISSEGIIQVCDNSQILPNPSKTVYGQAIMGLIQLNSGYHLILINEYKNVGIIQGKAILRASRTSILRIGSANSIIEYNKKLEKTYLDLLEYALSVKSYYFSFEFDLTTSIQNQHLAEPKPQQWQMANSDFFYNYYISEPLMDAAKSDSRVGSIICPVISGFVEIRLVWLKNQEISVALITRRSRHKQGTRYFSRGVDDEGNVSNNAETEQIVEFGQQGDQSNADIQGLIISLLQVRGSIPVRWAQVITGKYKPRMEIDLKDSEAGFQKHMEKLIKKYGKAVMVNLSDKVKYEKPVCDSFRIMSGKYCDKKYIEYVHFDFHKECSKMRFENVSILISQIKDNLDSFGSFACIPSKSKTPISVQSGIIRTNCMDCLDRTNVVQSVLATNWLLSQFRKYKLLKENETFDAYNQITATLRTIWTDNADYVSMAYSGTGALKTEYTRTGKYTKMGLLNDGYNSIERYIRNNFFDGDRQNSYDLFLGYYRFSNEVEDPIIQNMSTDCKMLIATLMSAIFLLILTLSTISLKNIFSFKIILGLIIWPLILYYGAETLFKKHAFEVLNWPSLVSYPYRPFVAVTNSKVQVPYVSQHLDTIIDKFSQKQHLKTD